MCLTVLLKIITITNFSIVVYYWLPSVNSNTKHCVVLVFAWTGFSRKFTCVLVLCSAYFSIFFLIFTKSFEVFYAFCCTNLIDLIS